MFNTRSRPTLITAFCTLLLAAPAQLPAQSPAVDQTTRVVAIGDIPGDFDVFVSILQQARLIDDRHHWIGGTATLVQTGDFTDRGPGVRAVMDLLMALEEQAQSADGRVVVLLGNHEVMNLVRNVRDVNPQVYASFTDSKSESRRKAAFRRYESLRMAGHLAGFTSADLQQTKEEWMAAHPPGFLEYQKAFGPKGRYGHWLRAKRVVLRLGDSIFLHAGIPPALAAVSLDEINERVRRELRVFDSYQRALIERKLILLFFMFEEILRAVADALKVVHTAATLGNGRHRGLHSLLDQVLNIRGSFAMHPNGPLWFRGYAKWNKDEGAAQMTSLLDRYGATRFIVWHTV